MAEEQSDDTAAIQDCLESAVAAGIPGIACAISTKTISLWSGSAGKADLSSGRPVESDTLFGIGSITKTFVAVIVLQLLEEGRLSLTTTAKAVLGGAVDGIPNADRATIAQLLNHTSGIPSWEDDPIWIREGRGAMLDVSRIWGKWDTLSYLGGRNAHMVPGEIYSYSNTNYTLLGLVVEKITRDDLTSQLRIRILRPLGLKDVYLEGFEGVPVSRLSRRYHWATPEFKQVAGVTSTFHEMRPGLIDASTSNLSMEWAAGGLVSTAQDLALYLVALRDGRLLNRKSMEFMTDWISASKSWQIGHNVFRHQYSDDLVIVGHDGGTLGFTASAYWIESADVVATVLCNVGSIHSGKAAEVLSLVGKSRQFIEAAIGVAGKCPPT